MAKRAHGESDPRVGAVGRNVPRAEGREKVTGRARYVDDLVVPGMLLGATLRTSIARGRVMSVERDPAFDWSGFTVVDHRDIPAGGRNRVALIADDQPFLVESEVNHPEEPLLLLAHADRARLAEGLRHVRVDYRSDEAVLDLDGATEIHKELVIARGDLAEGFARSDLVVEGIYRTGHQEQLYIEPNGMIARPGPDGDGDGGGILVEGSLQCPYYVVKALARLLGLPEARVRVVQTTTGGGFGGKEEYPSLLAGHAALLALKARAPVKMVYTRHEDLLCTTKRHPSITRIRAGVRADGLLEALDIDLRLDGGAYVTLSPVVLSRAAIHATGPYRCDQVRIRGRVMKTNTPPNGAFRGFGAPQSQFAADVHMDRIAEELGLDPIALRRKNLLRAGDTTATGQRLDGSSAEEVLDRALARHARLRRKEDKQARKEKDKEARRRGLRRGTGVSLFFHGSGFTGGGEITLASRAAVELLPRGARVLVAATEIGQGTRTMLAQIVADALAIPYDWVETQDPDTAQVPDSGPTVASRTCMIVGRILQSACGELRQRLGPYRTPREYRRRARALLAESGVASLVFSSSYQRPAEMRWSDETYQGDAYGAYAWGCNVADVEVDPVSYQARCTRLTSAIDVGKAIHPLLVEGQIEGGTLQSVGWALYEEVVMQGGRMGNAELTNYIIPTTLDTPEMAIEIVENAYRHGPFGAKGVGEAPVDGPAAAIVNALRQALGVRIDAIPATAERIMERLDAAARERAAHVIESAAAAAAASARWPAPEAQRDDRNDGQHDGQRDDQKDGRRDGQHDDQKDGQRDGKRDEADD